MVEIHSTEELKHLMEQSQGYCVTVTLLNTTNTDENKNKLAHFLLLKNFPLLDMLKSHVKTKALMIEELEKEATLPEF